MPLRYLHPPFAVLGDLSQGEDGLPAELWTCGDGGDQASGRA